MVIGRELQPKKLSMLCIKYIKYARVVTVKNLEVFCELNIEKALVYSTQNESMRSHNKLP